MTIFFFFCCHALPLAERRADHYGTYQEELFEFDIFTFRILKKMQAKIELGIPTAW
jgi:hypothetical protein